MDVKGAFMVQVYKRDARGVKRNIPFGSWKHGTRKKRGMPTFTPLQFGSGVC